MTTKQNPLVSIVVPICNVGDYLEECLDSIVKQTYQNLEVVLLDDGSTDESGRIIDEYSKKYKIFKPIHQKHQGVASARENGVAAATGEWISFIDPDDYVKKEFIEDLLNTALKNEADIASCGLEAFAEEKDRVLKKSPEWPNRDMSGRDMINETMLHKFPAYLPLNIFRASLFKDSKLKFPIGREYEDVAAKIKLLFYAKKISFLDKKLYFYRMRSSGITGKQFSKARYDDLTAAILDIRQFLEKTGTIKDFIYMDYYEFCTMMTLLNYLAREKKLTKETKRYWREIRKTLKRLYKTAKFPSTKTKLLNGILLALSKNKPLYSALYMKAKK